VSRIQASLQQVSTSVLDTDKTLDLRVIPLLDGSLRTKSNEENTQLRTIKNVGVNLATFPIQTLCEIHQGVSDELRIREQHIILVINEFKMDNDNTFVEKAHPLKEKEELVTRSQSLEVAIMQACQTLPEIHIL